MNLKYFVFILFFISHFSYSQEETLVKTDSIEVRENESLYNADWKLIKMAPKFSITIDMVLTFDKLTNQLKAVKTQSSSPVLKGTDLITTKEKSVEYFQWSYGIKNATFEGDNVKSTMYDYSTIELKSEGYAFKIVTLTDTNLVLEVIKAPTVIFGNSISKHQKIYFNK